MQKKKAQSSWPNIYLSTRGQCNILIGCFSDAALIWLVRIVSPWFDLPFSPLSASARNIAVCIQAQWFKCAEHKQQVSLPAKYELIYIHSFFSSYLFSIVRSSFAKFHHQLGRLHFFPSSIPDQLGGGGGGAWAQRHSLGGRQKVIWGINVALVDNLVGNLFHG